MVLRRIASAIDPRTQGARRRRSILNIAADDFLAPLRPRRGSKGGDGYGGWDLTRVAEPAFWAALLLSQRRERFTMTLLGQIHRDAAAVGPYVAEKRATLDILEAIPSIDADSLIGFVNVAVMQYQPPGSSGEPLVPIPDAQEILKATIVRGAMVGELRPEAAREAWLAAHPPRAGKEAEPEWKTAQGRAETLYQSWQARRRGERRSLI